MRRNLKKIVWHNNKIISQACAVESCVQQPVIVLSCCGCPLRFLFTTLYHSNLYKCQVQYQRTALRVPWIQVESEWSELQWQFLISAQNPLLMWHLCTGIPFKTHGPKLAVSCWGRLSCPKEELFIIFGLNERNY